MIVVIDSKGNQLPNQIVRGNGAYNLYFDKVSVRLWSTKTLYVVDTEGNDLQITATFLQPSKHFSFFDVDVANANILTSVSKQLVTAITQNSVKIHPIKLAFSSVNAVVESTELLIQSADYRVQLKIVLHAESEDEEERYKVLLGNANLRLDERYIKAFAETDLDEHLIDQALVNRKREELISELYSSKGFIGSYLGLINAIKFFGYDDDVFIRAYWSKFDTKLQKDLLKAIAINNPSERQQLAKEYLKTNLLSLVYRLNDFNGEIAADGFPDLIEIFENRDKAIIKMRNMQTVLELDFLPSHLYFLDVLGEEFVLQNIKTLIFSHDAIINYAWKHLPFDRHQMRNDLQIKAQNIILTLNVDPDVSTLNENNVYEFDGLVTDFADYSTEEEILQSRFQLDNIAILHYRLDDDYVAILDTIVTTDFRVIDESDNSIAWQRVSHADGLSSADREVKIAIRTAGTYRLILQWFDYENTPHTVQYVYVVKPATIDFWLSKTPNIVSATDNAAQYVDIEDYLTRNTTQIELNVLPKINNTAVIENQPINLFKELYNTLATQIGLPVIAYKDAVWSVGSPAGNDIARYYSDMHQHYTHDKITDLRYSQLNSFVHSSIDKYGPSYVAIYSDLLGDGSAQDRFIELTDLATEKTERIQINYSNPGQTAEIKLAALLEFANTVNRKQTGPFSLFAAYVLELNLQPTGVTQLGIMLLSKQFESSARIQFLDLPTRFKTVKREIRPFVDTRSWVYLRFIGASAGLLRVEIDDAQQSVSVQLNTLDDLLASLEDFAQFEVFSLSADFAVLFHTSDFSIEHASIGGKHIGVTRQSTHKDFVRLNYGEDIIVGQQIYAFIDESLYTKLYDIEWLLTLPDLTTISQTSYVFRYLTIQVGQYSLKLSGKNSDGEELVMLRESVIHVRSEHVNDHILTEQL